MKNTLETLIFFGNERLVSGLKTNDTPILTALISAGYKIAAIVAHHTDGKSRSNRSLEVAQVAKLNNIPLFLPNNPLEIIEQLKNLHADAAILVAYGQLIPQDLLDIFPCGIINVHPSLLPLNRGSTPIESSIYQGDLETGISIMRLSSGMDEGPVFAQLSIPIAATETKFDLYNIIVTKSAQLLLDTLPAILDGSLRPVPQDEAKATYTKLLTKADSKLDIRLPATTCERTVRAHLGFPKTKSIILGYEITITKSHVSTEARTVLDIRCGDGKFLSIDELIAPSGKTISSSAFLNGYAAA